MVGMDATRVPPSPLTSGLLWVSNAGVAPPGVAAAAGAFNGSQYFNARCDVVKEVGTTVVVTMTSALLDPIQVSSTQIIV